MSDLLSREVEARTKRLGIWGSWAYRVEDALDVKRLDRLMHSYQLVEGRVVAVGKGRGRVYLNFTQDWRSDFTISVERKDVPSFTATGIDLRGLVGKQLRVRAGYNGAPGRRSRSPIPSSLNSCRTRAPAKPYPASNKADTRYPSAQSFRVQLFG